MYLSIHAPLIERVKYCPTNVATDEVGDALAELEYLRTVCEENDIDPDNAVASFESKDIDTTATKDKLAQYESFLEGCMNCLNGHWPTGADIDDQNLLTTILDAIRKGEGATDL